MHSTLIAACLFLGLFAVEASAAPKSRRPTITPAESQPRRGAARLIVQRSPNLGSNVIVRLFIDDMPADSLTYGRGYDELVPAGRRLVTLVPSPDPRWPIPYNVSLNTRPGRTYKLTVIDAGSGLLGVRRR